MRQGNRNDPGRGTTSASRSTSRAAASSRLRPRRPSGRPPGPGQVLDQAPAGLVLRLSPVRRPGRVRGGRLGGRLAGRQRPSARSWPPRPPCSGWSLGGVRRPAWRSLTVAGLLLLVATVVVTRPTPASSWQRDPAWLPNAMLTVVSRVAPDGALGRHTEASRRPSGACSPATGSRTWPIRCRACRPGRPCWPTPRARQEGRRARVAAQERVCRQRLGGGAARARAGVHRHLGARLRPAVRHRAGALAMVAACAERCCSCSCLMRCSPLRWPSPAGASDACSSCSWWRRCSARWPCWPARRCCPSWSCGRPRPCTTSDEYVGLLLAGSTWPALAAFLLGRWLTRRRLVPGLSPRARPRRERPEELIA